MNVFFDLFPALAFFLVYKFWGIYAATFILIIVSLLQFAYTLIRYRKIDFLQVMVVVLVLVFGSATLILRDAVFLQWKVSIASWLMAAAFLISARVGKMPLIQRMLKNSIELPALLWKNLNFFWGIYFLVIGVLNLIIAKCFSLNAWVDFKVFGIFGLTIVFVLAQGIYLQKYLKT